MKFKFSALPFLIFILLPQLSTAELLIAVYDKGIRLHSLHGKFLESLKFLPDSDKSSDVEKPISALKNFEQVGTVVAGSQYKCGVPIEQEPLRSIEITDRIYKNLNSADHILVSAKDGNRAQIINIKTMETLLPPCPASVQNYTISDTGDSVAFVAKQLEKIYLSPSGWGAVDTGKMELYVYNDLTASSSPTRIEFSEKIYDVRFGNHGEILVLLGKSNYRWYSPKNWLFSIAGHPEYSVRIYLSSYDKDGKLIKTQKIGKDTVNGSAVFVDLKK